MIIAILDWCFGVLFWPVENQIGAWGITFTGPLHAVSSLHPLSSVVSYRLFCRSKLK